MRSANAGRAVRSPRSGTRFAPEKHSPSSFGPKPHSSPPSRHGSVPAVSTLAATMHEVGPGATLFAAKSLACACGLLLYLYAYLRSLAVVSGICLGVAVIPWIMVALWAA